jgi:hypothetical protein
MAGEWIKFEASTPEKREVFFITAAMGWTDPDLTVGKLLKVWRWFDQQTVGGNADGVTLALLDSIIGVTGFAQAMCNVGWLVSDERGVSLPNFDRHNGKTAKERALTAKRVAKHKTNATPNAKGNGVSVTGALPREEKRREELKPPIPPAGGQPDEQDGSLKRKAAVSMQTFLADCRKAGEKPIPDDDPVFAYATKVKLPYEFLALHWVEFKDRYLAPGSKRYKDWRIVFRKSVKANWFKLWFIGADGSYALTTAGQQAQRSHQEAA